jgi:Domain of unknown function (DUF3597)
MSRFSELMHHIFKHEPVAQNPNAGGPIGGATGGGGARPNTPQAATPGATATATQVNVEEILDKMAATNHEKLDWKHSIVDLMKLVGMDSGLAPRKELAAELHYTGDTNDSAAMNIWLHKAVMKKLAENGGKVPASLLD